MVSPITTLTIGNLYTDTPGYISSINLSVPNESTWEIEDNLQLPHYCQMVLNMFTLENTYQAKRKTF